MSKSGGLGDNLYVSGNDISNDVGSLSKISATLATLEVTGIDKSAHERLPGLRDGKVQFAPWFNKTGAHAVLGALSGTDLILTYCRGTTIGNAAASLYGRQLNYDGKRDAKGALTLEVSQDGDGFGLEWGKQLTAGIRTDTAATEGTTLDLGAAPAGSYGAQAYLHVFDITATDVTVTIEHSTDNATWSSLAAFTALSTSSANTAQRIATSNTTAVDRYLRATTTTSGGFTSVAFAVMIDVNLTAGVVF
jgi:hypothetical protein